ncbi:hypothetical protein CHH57_01595 [Niallia circulans]|uniref:Uncharacterized protein n=1 Tax=Niallia circulans TaxID=1397 RepID=A0AA91TWB0_NIACI|nr:hypothetical protein [Niallia circulans]PAD85031.1 hypothetical protein CHH57_01595 [Niallia circulans]
MTSYDEIWTTFLNNCKVSDLDLPQTNKAIYESIRNAVMYMNNRLRTDLICDDVKETLDKEITQDHLLILANYIRYIFLINQKTYFENLWQPFSKDVGLKNFSTQLNSLKSSIELQDKTIDRLIMNTEVDFL